MPETEAADAIEVSTQMSLLHSIHPSIRASFISLPSDPSVPLTPEQLQAIFPHPEVWRDMIALTLQQHQAVQASDTSVA